MSGAGDVVAYARGLIDKCYSQQFTVPTIANIPEESNTSPDILDKISTMLKQDNEMKVKQYQEKMIEHKRELIEQKKETNTMFRSTVDCMEEFSKNSSVNINNKGSEWLDILVVAEKSEIFPPLPEVVNLTTFGTWEDAIEARMLTTPWDITGLSIINHPHVRDLSEATTAYRIRATILSKILIDLLNKKDPNIVTSLRTNVATNDGIKLLESIFNFLLPLDNLQILYVLTDLGGCVQQNGETVEGFCAPLENIFICIQKMRYNDVSELHLV